MMEGTGSNNSKAVSGMTFAKMHHYTFADDHFAEKRGFQLAPPRCGVPGTPDAHVARSIHFEDATRVRQMLSTEYAKRKKIPPLANSIYNAVYHNSQKA